MFFKGKSAERKTKRIVSEASMEITRESVPEKFVPEKGNLTNTVLPCICFDDQYTDAWGNNELSYFQRSFGTNALLMQLFVVQHKPKFVLFSENTEFEHRDLSNKKVSRANAEYQVIDYGIKNQFFQTAFFFTVDELLNQAFLEKTVPFLEKRLLKYPATSTAIVAFFEMSRFKHGD